uniref:Uncharacterized protein LOC104265996 n=1 Tax=Phallusia mammillata TaxID=59560 RepID=A0A6F9DJP0_9ASCI|nr:uncharacterized protein LOC104265996 [Phallusia mammillata]
MSVGDFKGSAQLIKINIPVVKKEATYTDKWFRTEQEARNCLAKFCELARSTPDLVYTNNFAINNKATYWDAAKVPYTILRRETMKLYPKDDKKKVPALIMFLRTVGFPQHRLVTDTGYFRNYAGKAIRSALSANDPDLLKVEGFCVRCPELGPEFECLEEVEEEIVNLNEVSVPNQPDITIKQYDQTRQKKLPDIASKSHQNNIKFLTEQQKNTDWKSFSTLEEAEQCIDEFEKATLSKFVLYNKFSYDIKKSWLRWDDEGMPYIVAYRHTRACQHGKDYHAVKHRKIRLKKIAEAKAKGEDLPNAYKMYGTKKVGCQAKIFIRHIIKFPEFKKFADTTEGQKQARHDIKKALNENPNIVMEHSFKLLLPSDENHSGHPMGNAAVEMLPIDKSIIEKIGQFAKEGIRSYRVIENLLRKYVNDELFKDQDPPLANNRRYFPTRDSIRNYYLSAKRKLPESTEETKKKSEDSDSDSQETGKPKELIVTKLNEIQNMTYSVRSRKVLRDMLAGLNTVISIAKVGAPEIQNGEAIPILTPKVNTTRRPVRNASKASLKAISKAKTNLRKRSKENSKATSKSSSKATLKVSLNSPTKSSSKATSKTNSKTASKARSKVTPTEEQESSPSPTRQSLRIQRSGPLRLKIQRGDSRDIPYYIGKHSRVVRREKAVKKKK